MRFRINLRKASAMELEKFVRENLTKRYIKLKEPERNSSILKAREGDNNSRKIVLESSYPFIIQMALKWTGNNIPLCDLITIGVMGCSRAIDEFDMSIGCCFLTYAKWHIKRAIQTEIADHAKTIRIPQGVVTATKKYYKYINNTSNEKPLMAKEKIEMLPFTSSLNQINDNGTEIIDLIKGPSENTIESVINKDLVDKLTKCLSAVEKKIIELRFNNNLMLMDIAMIMGISRERIRQIEVRAIKKMRKYYSIIENRNIKMYDQFSAKKRYRKFAKINNTCPSLSA